MLFIPKEIKDVCVCEYVSSYVRTYLQKNILLLVWSATEKCYHVQIRNNCTSFLALLRIPNLFRVLKIGYKNRPTHSINEHMKKS